MKYRSDIDGLRAVAVMSVILTHAGMPHVKAGFLGVDVFFVISGYLITTILKHELDEGKFSLARFYERRARRILPALVLVVAACVPFAFWLLLPDFLQNFGQSVAATLLFSNNILLALTSGYWELESSFKPLLHTWSLGVEEQFYLAFPLLLALVWKVARRAQLATILILGIISFALSEHGWRHYPDASFYLPTSRAWELMVGCAITYFPRRPRKWDGLLAGISLLAVLGSMVLFDEYIPSPSVYSAVPVLGAAGIILFSRPGTLACRALSLRPVVFVGLISYSAYLWHQPLFAFARAASLAPPSGAAMALLSVLTLVLAWLSWRFVEVPFRKPGVVRLRRFVPLIALPTAALIALGVTLHVQQGFPRRAFPNIGAAGDVYIGYNDRIRGYSADAFPANGRANVLLLGDSFGRDIGNVLLESGVLEGKNFVYRVSYEHCDPAHGVALVPRALLERASVVVVGNDKDAECLAWIVRELDAATDAPIVFFGSKNFGWNINPYGRVPMERRAALLIRVDPSIARVNDLSPGIVGEDRFVDTIRLLGPDGSRVRFFDDDGNPLSPDRLHFTRYGAVYLARRLIAANPPAFRSIAEARAPAAD